MTGDRVAELAGLTVRALEDLRYAILAPPAAGRAHAAKQVGAAVEAIARAFPAPSVPVEEPVEPQASAVDRPAAVSLAKARIRDVVTRPSGLELSDDVAYWLADQIVDALAVVDIEPAYRTGPGTEQAATSENPQLTPHARLDSPEVTATAVVAALRPLADTGNGIAAKIVRRVTAASWDDADDEARHQVGALTAAWSELVHVAEDLQVSLAEAMDDPAPAPAESSTVERRRADAEAQPGTIFGQDAGDGLDQERADARLAIEILRLQLAHGADALTIEMGLLFRPGDRFALTQAQADLLRRLDPRLPPAGGQPTEWRRDTTAPTYPRPGEG